MAADNPLAAALRKWTRNHDFHVRAAVELLIWHEHWLGRASFVKACVTAERGEAWISWPKAREFHDSSPRGSTSELAVLDLAIAIGENRYRLSHMGTQHRAAIVRAVAQALDAEGMLRG